MVASSVARRAALAATRTWVVKVGSALVTNEGRGLDRERLAQWVEEIVALQDQGVAVVLVSSGATAEGVQRLGWRQRPAALYQAQAAAAVGQSGLVEAYARGFRRYARHTAQVLLTHDDLVDRRRYLNARRTLRGLLGLGVVPVINENDTLASEAIRFGDNDTLAALVANLVEAEVLLILTDQAGVYDADPRQNPNAGLLHEAPADDPGLLTLCGEASGELGSGGMRSKVLAAAKAARSGATTIIACGRDPGAMARLRAGERLGTLLWPTREPIAARKQWLASQLQLGGRLWLDEGAVRVITEAGRSLLPVGVTAVAGDFARGAMVACLNPHGQEIARGLVNYSARESDLIRGCSSRAIGARLGYVDDPELIHRDNLVLTTEY